MIRPKTLSIIKPDATSKNIIGKRIDRFAAFGIHADAGPLILMEHDKAVAFIDEHEGKPFFPNLVDYITSAPLFVQVRAGDNVVKQNKALMGATSPGEAAPGTIRENFGETIDVNVVHRADSEDSAGSRTSFFFDDSEIVKLSA